MRRSWRRRFGIVALCGGLWLVNDGVGGTLVSAAPLVKEDPHAGVTQNWDKNLPSTSRFTVLSAFGGAAVRDNNTGLVWEQAPDPNWGANPPGGTANWYGAVAYCAGKAVGGTLGWRLPSVVELWSVLDPTLQPPIKVPTTVFTFSGPQTFWSATTASPNIGGAWIMPLNGGIMTFDGKTFIGNNAWCVRGSMNADVY